MDNDLGFSLEELCGPMFAVLGNEDVRKELKAEDMLVRLARQYSSVDYERWLKNAPDGRLGDDQQKIVDRAKARRGMNGSAVEDIKEYVKYLRFLHHFYSVGCDDPDLFNLEDMAMIEITLYQLKFALDKNFTAKGKLIDNKPFEYAFGEDSESKFVPVARSKRVYVQREEKPTNTNTTAVGPAVFRSDDRFRKLLARVEKTSIADAPVLSEVLQVLWIESSDAREIFDQKIRGSLDQPGEGKLEKEFLKFVIAKDQAVELKERNIEVIIDCGAVMDKTDAIRIGYCENAYIENVKLDRKIILTIADMSSMRNDGYWILEEELLERLKRDKVNNLNQYQIMNRINGARISRYVTTIDKKLYLNVEKLLLYDPNGKTYVVNSSEWRKARMILKLEEDDEKFYVRIEHIVNAGYYDEYFNRDQKCDGLQENWKIRDQHDIVSFAQFWEMYDAGMFVQRGKSHVCYQSEYAKDRILDKNFPNQRNSNTCSLYSYDGLCIRCGVSFGRILLHFDKDDGGYWSNGDYARWIMFKQGQNHFVSLAEKMYLEDSGIKFQFTVSFLAKVLIRASLGINGIMECVWYNGKFIDRDKNNFYIGWKQRMKRDKN